MLGIHHAAGPVAFGLLDGGHSLGHFLEFFHEEGAVLVVGGQVFQNLGQAGQYPSVAAGPEVLLPVDTFVLGIDIFGVAVVEVLFRVEHYLVGIGDVLVQFVQIEGVMSNLVEFRHDRHHHVQSVAPPPVVVVRSTHLIFHDFAGPSDLVIFGGQVVEVGIRLEADLVVTEQYIFV